MRILPFHPEHVHAIHLQPMQVATVSHISLAYLEGLAALGPAATAEVDGRIVACAGVAEIGFGMGSLWAFLSVDSGRHFVRLDRCVRRLLEIPSYRRIEASAAASFQPACRWLELLGFDAEGVMRKYGPNGEDCMRYAKVRP